MINPISDSVPRLSLVASFFLAYLSEDYFMSQHTLAGYTVGGLITFRLVGGLIGIRHARFSNLVYSSANISTYLKQADNFRAERYIGHNPAGGDMVIALMISLSMAVVTGLAT